LSTFHTQVEHISHFMSPVEKNYRAQMPKNARNHARNSPFPLTHVDVHLTYECLDPPHSPCQMTARSLYALPHNDATNCPLVTTGRRKFTPKLPLPLRRSPPKSNIPIPSPTHSPPPTASGSNQPFRHNSHVQTDRWATRMFNTMSALLAVLIESDALITRWLADQRTHWNIG